MADYTQEEVVEALLHLCEETQATNVAAVVESESGALLVQFKVTLHENPEAAIAALEITPEQEDIPDGQIH